MSMSHSPDPSRVFLFGLDGATFTLLRPWMEEGHLPALARLVAEGAWGPLASTIPALTPVAWNSMVTGVYPGKHGVYGFVRRKPDSYEWDVVTSRDRRRPAIWNLLDRAGRRSIVVDVPFTYPPEPINGIMVAGLGTPDVTTEFVHPRSLREILVREFGPYPLDIYFTGDVRRLLDDAHHLTDHRLAVTRFLARESPWDFFMLGLMMTDRLQHPLWGYLDERHSRYDSDDARRLRPAIRAYYRHVDEMIAELSEMLDAQTAFLIASDHGFGPLERSFSLLRWLEQKEYLRLGGPCWQYAPPAHVPAFTSRGTGQVIQCSSGTGDQPSREGLMFAVDRPDAYAGAVFTLPDLDLHRRYEIRAAVLDATPGALLEFDDLTRGDHPIIGGGPVQKLPDEISAVFQPKAREVELMAAMTTYGGNPCGHITITALTLSAREDWSHSLAYIMDTSAAEGRRIHLNVMGREPFGIVETGDSYEQLRSRIMAELQVLRDEHGRPLVDRIYRREELYRGPYAEEGPDLVVLYADGVGEISHAPELIGHSVDGPISLPITRGNSGNHRRDGILIATGGPIRRGMQIAADIVDLCPTILYLLGVHVPADLDGRVLSEIITTPVLAGAGPADATLTASASVGEVQTSDSGPEVYTDADRRKVEDRLRKLGYIE